MVTGLYILLLSALLIQPHVFRGHIFFLSSAWTQSLVTLGIFLCALIVYSLHQWETKRRDQEHRQLQDEKTVLGQELNDSFQYIASINRKLPLIHELTSGLVKHRKATHNEKKDALQQLLILATISLTKTPWGLFRFVDTKQGRTMKEFFYGDKIIDQEIPNVGNKHLLSDVDTNKEDGVQFIPSSDTEFPYRCVFIFPHSSSVYDRSLVQAVVDQAQLFYTYLYSPFVTKERR